MCSEHTEHIESKFYIYVHDLGGGKDVFVQLLYSSMDTMLQSCFHHCDAETQQELSSFGSAVAALPLRIAQEKHNVGVDAF